MDMMWYRRRGLMVTPHIDIVTGAIASFNSHYNKIRVKSLICDIEPIQEGEGDPSPENIRPISGRTGMTVSYSGADTSDPTSISVNWQTEARTVYGGTLDVVSGKLTVDRMYKELQNITEWQKSVAYPGGIYSPAENFTEDGHEIKKHTPFICTHAKTVVRLSEYVAGTCYMDGSVNLFIMSTETTIAQWREYLDAQKIAGTPVSCCLYLNNPYTVQLTQQEVKTILGVNNIWCDSGDVSVNYWKWGN